MMMAEVAVAAWRPEVLPLATPGRTRAALEPAESRRACQGVGLKLSVFLFAKIKLN